MCSAQGGPGNAYTWTKLSDGRVVSATERLSIGVINASSGDTYQCAVANIAGNGMAQVTLNGKTSFQSA